MKKEIYNLEGIEIEVEKYDKSDKDAERRRLGDLIRFVTKEINSFFSCSKYLFSDSLVLGFASGSGFMVSIVPIRTISATFLRKSFSVFSCAVLVFFGGIFYTS